VTKPLLPLVVTEDNRLAGVRRLVFHPRGVPLVQIPDTLRKCVAFLACKRKSGMQERGTVFFVGESLNKGTEEIAGYAVTAAHVIERIKELGIDDNTYFRMDNRQHGVQYVAMPLAEWVRHDDPKVDVAVAALDVDNEIYDHLFIPTDMFVAEEDIQDGRIAPGCDLFFPGLFVRHKGEQSNIPIMRTGTIAAMPGEPIMTSRGEMIAYLAEVRSIGGFSGSPVFAHVGQPYLRQHHFLGLIQGHYGTRDIMDSTKDDILLSDPLSREINMGIAIVTPSEYVSTVLNMPRFVEQRAQVREQLGEKRRQSLPTPD
jgi:hypothetical protein